jgi:hypothetical protein
MSAIRFSIISRTNWRVTGPDAPPAAAVSSVLVDVSVDAVSVAKPVALGALAMTGSFRIVDLNFLGFGLSFLLDYDPDVSRQHC